MQNRGAADYLRAMQDLDEQGRTLSNTELARVLNVRPPSVTGMVDRLAKEGLVTRSPERHLRLTPKGRRMAHHTVRRHRLIETWLIRTLGVDWAMAHEEAHRLEHAISPELEAAIAEYLGHPSHDPHGAPIPDAEGRMLRDDAVPLRDLADGEKGVVARMSDRDPERLAYWSEAGLAMGANVRRLRAGRFGSGVELEIAGRTAVIGPEALEGVWVRRGRNDDA